MDHPLVGARVKVARAREHLGDLDARRTEWRRTNAQRHGVVVKFDEDEGCHLVCLDEAAMRFERGPRELSAVVGDLVHNARSALDYVAWQLALRHLGREPTKREARQIQFPIAPDAAAFGDSAVLQHISATDAGAIERLQPYRHETRADIHREPLMILRDMSVIDKHRLLIGFAHKVTMRDVRYNVDPPAPFVVESVATDRDGEYPHYREAGLFVLQRFRIEGSIQPEDTQVEIDAESALDITFRSAAHGVHMPELEAIVTRVERVIDDLDRLF